MNEKNKSLMKLIIIYLIYFSYTTVVSYCLKVFGISNNVVLIFISDLLFLIGIIYLYRDSLKKDYDRFVNKYKFSKRALFILKWIAILFGINIVGGMITELLVPNLLEDGNTSNIYSFSNLSTIYTVFKTLFFASLAETLVFQKSIRIVINNNTLFIIVSSLIYSLINVMYTDISLLTIIDMVSYFVFSSVLSYVYIKNNDNIIVPIIIKFFYNLIPLSLMIISIGV